MSERASGRRSDGQAGMAALPAATPVDHRTVVGRHRRAHTRARIVAAAAAVYADKGPDSPVIDDFVKAAGMSRGTFYNHFTTTAELLAATVEWFDDQLAVAILDTIRRYPGWVEKSAMAMRLHLHWITADPTLCAFFARVPQVAEVGRREAREQLRQGMAAGAFQVPDVDAGCDLVFGTLAETIRRVARSPDKPKRCDEVVTTVLVGLGVERSRIREAMALPLPTISVSHALGRAPVAAEAEAVEAD